MGTDECLDAPNRSTTVTTRVIQNVASALDVDPLDLDPLYETIDPDVLDSLFTASTDRRRDGRIEFTMDGCDVTVSDSGRVEVIVPEESQQSAERDESPSNSDVRDGHPGADD